jgi:predicted alpha/beta hydrolase family esterase
MGHTVIMPRFPTPEGQNREAWMKILSEYDKYFDENLIVSGHSLSCVFLLDKLQNIEKPIKACFLTAGFLHPLNSLKFDTLNKTFYEPEQDFNWNKIKQNCKHFFVYASDNDPYVPQSASQEIADKLGVQLTLVKDAGHFNEGMGFTEFPQILEDIKKIV